MQNKTGFVESVFQLAKVGLVQHLAIVQKLNAAVVKALDDPLVNARLVAQGAEPVPMSVDEFSRFVRSEYETWIPVVRASGAKAE